MEAIRQTFLNRGTDCTLSSLKRIASIYKDSNMINRWTAFTNKTLGVTLNFEIVVQVIIEFIEPLVHSIEDENSLIRLEEIGRAHV